VKVVCNGMGSWNCLLDEQPESENNRITKLATRNLIFCTMFLKIIKDRFEKVFILARFGIGLSAF